MASNYSPSVNIIRDEESNLDYFVTPNAQKSVFTIFNEFKKGIHSFTLIGSYGTGKSSFLWALEQTLKGKRTFFDLSLPKEIQSVEFINVVGVYESMIDHFHELLNVSNSHSGNQELFDALFQKYEEAGKDEGLLVIQIDEMGKFLEYAVKNDPERELYFIQQLAEFANTPKRNILFISTLHQAFDTYGTELSEVERNEWRKIKGRLKELPFNEPIEQLLFLAAEKINSGEVDNKIVKNSLSLGKLIVEHKLFKIGQEFFESSANQLFPLDPISAYILTSSLQRYGQNERSLFSFLSKLEELENNKAFEYFSLEKVYDYLWGDFYTFMSARSNPDYIQWASIRSAIERVETRVEENQEISVVIVKSIGLFGLFSNKGATIDSRLLTNYLSTVKQIKQEVIEKALSELTRLQIIRFNKFNSSYKLFEGTDLDIEGALLKAENQVENDIDIVSKLKESFEFSVVTAKAFSYKTGTPRLFEFRITQSPIDEIPKDEIDGFINLLFNEDLSQKQLKQISKDQENAIIYCLFQNTSDIKSSLFEIEKSTKVLQNIDNDDLVARKELKNIIESHKSLLNHYVKDALYTDKVIWLWGGRKVEINSSKNLNQELSKISEYVYSGTPELRNELFNKHKISSAIHTARKNLFLAMAEHWDKKDLNFSESKFPAEKTIYISLLKDTGIHKKVENNYELVLPSGNSSVSQIWEASEVFLQSCRGERKRLTELNKILENKPYKLKKGLVDFWVPIFLFIKRGDYALYGDEGFIPKIDETRLHLISRQPKEYEIKSFELSDARIKLFNKYRELLNLDSQDTMTVQSFIECIGPIIVLYKNLPEYSKNTKRLSKEAINLRTAITKSEDPEKVFFEDFPEALEFRSIDVSTSQDTYEQYILKFQGTISEIRGAYPSLIDRIEKFITDEIIGADVRFSEYKGVLQKRYRKIKDHKLLKHQKTFLLRLNSPIDDRNSWIESISHAVLSKRLADIQDPEEDILKDKLQHLFQELDNLLEIEEISGEKDEAFKLDITTKGGRMQGLVIKLNSSKEKELEQIMAKLDKELKGDRNLKMMALAKLLKKELDNE